MAIAPRASEIRIDAARRAALFMGSSLYRPGGVDAPPGEVIAVEALAITGRRDPEDAQEGPAHAGAPVRRGPASVQKARFRKQERSRADRGQPPDPAGLTPDPGEERQMRAVRLRAPSPRDQERVDPAADLVEPAVGVEPQPPRRAKRATFHLEDLDAVGVVGSLPVVLPARAGPRIRLWSGTRGSNSRDPRAKRARTASRGRADDSVRGLRSPCSLCPRTPGSRVLRKNEARLVPGLGFDFGAGHEGRTRDIYLGKVALYH